MESESAQPGTGTPVSTTGRPIRVLVVDDHEMVRSGIISFLAHDAQLEVAAQATNGSEAIQQAIELQPDVVLLDLVMPGIDGIKAMYEIINHCPDTAVIVLSCYFDEYLVQAAIDTGAKGYLLKDVAVDDLIRAIYMVSEGQPVLSPVITQLLVNIASRRKRSHDRPVLTQREREIMLLLVEGLTNRQIAQRLGLSVSTIKTHVSNILSKLDAASRAEAVAIHLQEQPSLPAM
jgi:NarL family two-component system response regulator LiaR